MAASERVVADRTVGEVMRVLVLFFLTGTMGGRSSCGGCACTDMVELEISEPETKFKLASLS